MSKNNDNKIINFKTKTDDIIEFLEDTIRRVKEKKVDNVLVAMKLPEEDNGYIMSGFHNLNLMEKQEIISHLQYQQTVDIIVDLSRRNIT